MKKTMPATARSVALEVLLEVERSNAFSNLELNAALGRFPLERKDAGLATELVYGTLSRLNTLDWILNQLLKKPLGKLDAWVRSLLRLSIYQFKYLDRIPEHAVVHAAVEEAKIRGHLGTTGFVNGVLRSYLRQKDMLEMPAVWPKFKKIAVEYSHPEWLVKRWLSVYGEKDTVSICESNNRPPQVSVRCNHLKTNREDLVRKLSEQFPDADITPSTISPHGLLLSKLGNVAHSRVFKEGLCTIQDESSMLVGYAVAPRPGMRVLDTCAAPGGKTTHLAEIMENDGLIMALDIHDHKLKLIADNAKRLGISIIRTKQADARNLSEEVDMEGFDRILVDAPCSGFGVIRRKPDLKWQKKQADIDEIATVQLAILQQAAKWLKSGGKLVYSTCTIDPEENQKLIAHFLDENPMFALDTSLITDMPKTLHHHFHKSGGYIQILPHHFGSDGFFIARLIHR